MVAGFCGIKLLWISLGFLSMIIMIFLIQALSEQQIKQWNHLPSVYKSYNTLEHKIYVNTYTNLKSKVFD